MNKKNYIAITFGPITRLTEGVKSTKALWASSYFFSYLAREIIRPFKERTFILPIVSDERLWQQKEGIGCFPDRYIFESLPGDTFLLQNRIQEVFTTIASGIAETLNTKENFDAILTFIKNYLKTYFFEKTAKRNNISEEYTSILDILELQDSYNMKEEKNYLHLFFESNNLYTSFLVADAFPDLTKFNAIDEISRAEHSLLKGIFPMSYHKYIAIISADGDNMGHTIKQLHDRGHSVTELSKCLLSFGNQVVTVAQEYGARVIYLGGDDLLLFAPIKYFQNTVFGLVEELNQKFNEAVSELPSPPTLSFGVAIAYNKFPMGETLQLSKNLLTLSKDSGRNTVTYTLQKHSGQTFILKLHKNQHSYNLALELIRIYIGDAKLISSLTHWIGAHKEILSVILTKSPEPQREVRLKNYFNNSFNEEVHDSVQYFKNNIIHYLSSAYLENGVADESILATDSILRFIHFINTKRDGE